MKKIFAKLSAIILVIVLVIVLVGLIMIDSIAKAGLEKGARYALGVDTRVDKVGLSLLRGRLSIDGLNLSNPEGFSAAHLMRSGRFDLELKPSSAFSDTIVLNRFELDGLDINIEQKVGQSNISKVADNLRKFDTKEKQKGEATKTKGKKVKVDKIRITNVVAHFYLLPQLSPAGPITVKIPEIELSNVSSDQAEGVVVAQLFSRIVPAVLASVVQGAKGIVPTEFLEDLAWQIQDLTKALGQQTQKLVAQVENVGQAAGKVIQGVLEGVTKGMNKP